MIQRFLLALGEIGPGPLLRLAAYRLAILSGWYRRKTPLWSPTQVVRTPSFKSDVPAKPDRYIAWRAAHAPGALFDPDQVKELLARLSPDSKRDLEDRVQGIAAGEFRVFGGRTIKLGAPPAWDLLPGLEGVQAEHSIAMDRHWSAYDLESLPGDVKLLWEPARFAWVYDLVRAHHAGLAPQAAEVFWQTFLSWQEANPANHGLHWHSAQEVAVRALALSFAIHGFPNYWDTYPERLHSIVHSLSQHAARIPPTMLYARAQDNNHLIVESTALLVIGLTCPELVDAQRWVRLGRRTLDGAFKRQVFADGGYVQHSSTYHRLALQAGMLAAVVAERSGRPLRASTLDALRRMVAWLASHMQPESGHMPNFGPNDGANLLPLSGQPVQDHRPTLQAAGCLLFGERLLEPGPWDELALWLGVLISVDGKPLSGAPLQQMSFQQSGLYTLRQGEMNAILRAAEFRGRPGHSDQMHLDLWWKGENLALDAGTYLYNAPQPWENPFSSAWCHNTLRVDGEEPMLRGGRFLWLGWSKARLTCRWQSPDGELAYMQAEHSGFRPKGIRHQRGVLACGEGTLLVADRLLGEGEHLVQANWLLADGEWSLQGKAFKLSTAAGPVAILSEGPWTEPEVHRAGEPLLGEGSGAGGCAPGLVVLNLCGARAGASAQL